jgi:putative transposase
MDGTVVSGISGEVGESDLTSDWYKADMLALYQRLLPLEFLWAAQRRAQVRENNRVYHSSVVVWLMICQRLHPRGTLETAVLELCAGLPASFWPFPCKRLEQEMSKQTAAFNTARQQLSVPVVEECFDHTLQQLLQAQVREPQRRPAYFFDGTTVRMARSEELRKVYPPTQNQHGESHWPILRMLVAHDLYSGLALRPVWGAVNGSKAVSEQRLLEQMMAQLPPGAVAVGDANFGVFSVAYAAQQGKHPVVLRLTRVRAMRLAGGPLRDGMNQAVGWKPSREDRRSHRDLPKDAVVQGRLIVRQVQPSNGDKPFLLALFVSLEGTAEEAIELYGKRWIIEVDLRSLKGTLRLEELTCTSEAMVAKEIDVAMLAYNLVRAVMCTVAQEAGLQPRCFSFTQVRNVLQAFLPRIAAAPDQRTAQKLYDKLMRYLSQCKLRERQRPSYPRAVLPKPRAYPVRHP